MLGQHFSAGLPGWPRPRQARPPLQPSSQLPRLILTTLPRGEAEPEEPPRTGIGSLGSRLGGCDRGKMCSVKVSGIARPPSIRKEENSTSWAWKDQRGKFRPGF